MFFSLNRGANKFLKFLLAELKKGKNYQWARGWGANHPWMELWYRGKEVLINKGFDLTHKENIKKTREAITPNVDTVKLCVSKYSIERSQVQKK